MLEGLGIETGIDLNKVVETGAWISAFLKRTPGSKAGRAIAAKNAA
jgi:hydroxymethylglutaryl-CoA lyase